MPHHAYSGFKHRTVCFGLISKVTQGANANSLTPTSIATTNSSTAAPPPSGEHPTSSIPTLTPTLTPHKIHLIRPLIFDHLLRHSRLQRRCRLLDISTRDQLFLFQHFGMLKQFVLEVVVDVFLDYDVF